jgi:hypothetical protein
LPPRRARRFAAPGLEFSRPTHRADRAAAIRYWEQQKAVLQQPPPLQVPLLQVPGPPVQQSEQLPPWLTNVSVQPPEPLQELSSHSKCPAPLGSGQLYEVPTQLPF